MPLPSSVRSDQVQVLNLALLSGADKVKELPRHSDTTMDIASIASMDAQSLFETASDDRYWQTVFHTPEGFNTLGVFLPGMAMV